MNAPILKATDLSKTFSFPQKIEILQNINLTVYPGDTVAIMGASGEGKTTLLHILGSLDKPNSGSVEILGKPANAKTRLHEIGFVFQNYNLLEDLSLLENVLLPAKIARMPTIEGSPIYKRATALLEKVNLIQRKDYPITLLSGGEKQRGALARAFINNPSLILADEPSGNLDHVSSKEVHNLLISMAKEEKKGLIVPTHDLELARLCEKKWQLKEACLFPVNL